MDTNINDASRQAVVIGLGQAGLAGKMAGALTGILWPASGDDVWSSIKGRVEALINQKIAELEYRNVQSTLKSLKDDVQTYQDRLVDSKDKPDQISDQWDITAESFRNARYHFQTEASALLLLPLFAQFANLHLAHLRDGVQHGLEWGWTAQRHDKAIAKLNEFITNYRDWAQNTFDAGKPKFDDPGQRDNWIVLNRYVREMTLSVLDFAHYWPSFAFNAPAPHDPKRIIYSDPYAGDKYDAIRFPEPPSEPLTQIEVHGGLILSGVQVSYGHRRTPWQTWDGLAVGGNALLLASTPLIDPHSNPIVEIGLTLVKYIEERLGNRGYVEDRWACTTFRATIKFSDGPTAWGLYVGEPEGGENPFFYRDLKRDVTISYEGHVLASVHLVPGHAGTLVFGFRLPKSYDA